MAANWQTYKKLDHSIQNHHQQSSMVLGPPSLTSKSLLIRSTSIKPPIIKVPTIKTYHQANYSHHHHHGHHHQHSGHHQYHHQTSSHHHHHHPMKHPPTEKQSKDTFMKTLGLVTKEQLTELQSRRNERKRRTTANPQFSAAALEAKRIHNQEQAEKRARRRLLNYNNSNGHSSNSSALSYQKSVAVAQENANATAVGRIPSGGHVNSSGHFQKSRTPNEVVGVTVRLPSNGKTNKIISIEPQEMFPHLHLVTKLHFPIAECFDCGEECEVDIDSVLFCKLCRSLFHATCAAPIYDIKKSAQIKCPKCEKHRRQLEEERNKKQLQLKGLAEKKREWDEQVMKMKNQLNQLKERLVLQQKIEKLVETVKMIKETDIDIGICISSMILNDVMSSGDGDDDGEEAEMNADERETNIEAEAETEIEAEEAEAEIETEADAEVETEADLEADDHEMDDNNEDDGDEVDVTCSMVVDDGECPIEELEVGGEEEIQ